jgi:hypothetical protein
MPTGEDLGADHPKTISDLAELIFVRFRAQKIVNADTSHCALGVSVDCFEEEVGH